MNGSFHNDCFFRIHSLLMNTFSLSVETSIIQTNRKHLLTRIIKGTGTINIRITFCRICGFKRTMTKRVWRGEKVRRTLFNRGMINEFGNIDRFTQLDVLLVIHIPAIINSYSFWRREYTILIASFEGAAIWWSLLCLLCLMKSGRRSLFYMW